MCTTLALLSVVLSCMCVYVCVCVCVTLTHWSVWDDSIFFVRVRAKKMRQHSLICVTHHIGSCEMTCWHVNQVFFARSFCALWLTEAAMHFLYTVVGWLSRNYISNFLAEGPRASGGTSQQAAIQSFCETTCWYRVEKTHKVPEVACHFSQKSHW